MSSNSVERIRQIHESHSVFVCFPPDSDDSDIVLLVSDPSKDLGDAARTESLKLSEEELIAIAKECGDFNTRKLNIETKLHKDIRGHNDTTLNALVHFFFNLFL
jgi:hypothetical protein